MRQRLRIVGSNWWAASLALTAGLFVASTLGWLWYLDQREQQEHRAALDGLAGNSPFAVALADKIDQDAMVAGFRMMRKIVDAAPMDAYRDEEYSPGASVNSDEEILTWLEAEGVRFHI